LMLAGFLEAARRVGLGDLRLVAATRWNLDALRRRFPQIDWAEPEAHAARLAGEAAAGAWWAGVGDTPFQFSVGPWFLRMLRREQRGWGRFARRVMVNVGAEREVVPAAADFRAVVADLDRISTRDTQTADILVDALGVAPERVLAAADLAHV